MNDLDLSYLQQSVFHHPNRVFIPKSSDRKFNHGFQNPAWNFDIDKCTNEQRNRKSNPFFLKRLPLSCFFASGECFFLFIVERDPFSRFRRSQTEGILDTEDQLDHHPFWCQFKQMPFNPAVPNGMFRTDTH